MCFRYSFQKIMGISDDDIDECESTDARLFSEPVRDDLKESGSENNDCKFNRSLEWRSAKSPFESFVFGWGNTVDGELGLGGIEDQYILAPRQITFHDSENIKHGNYISCDSFRCRIMLSKQMIKV